MATEKARQRAHYYKRHIGDYKTDAGHLTMLQDGAYTRLLDLAYALDGRLPGDLSRIHALTRAGSRAEQNAVAEILAEFFELRDGHYRQSRVDRELAAMQSVSRKRQDAAQARWGKEPDANALHKDTKCNAIHKPLSTTQEPQPTIHTPIDASGQSPAGRACRLMRDAGCARTNPAHPDLLAALAEGVTPEELAATAKEGLEAGKSNPFPWAVTTARARRSQSSRSPTMNRQPQRALPTARAGDASRYPRPPELPVEPASESEKANG
ncbi:YdaU family protein [Arenimonas sp.]|uniref:YdaU family protein n=1 Tax=Arenimonas sp. TaxID=1872635 RepID=UPI0035B301D3